MLEHKGDSSTEGGPVNVIGREGVGEPFVYARRARTGERRGGNPAKKVYGGALDVWVRSAAISRPSKQELVQTRRTGWHM